MGQGLIELNLSVPVILEYEAVLKRPGMVPAYAADELDNVVDGLCALAQHRRIFFLWRPQLTDPKDEAVLELAVAADRASIVTYNVNHFRGAERFGVEILTPVQVLTQIGALE